MITFELINGVLDASAHRAKIEAINSPLAEWANFVQGTSDWTDGGVLRDDP
jgi:hypothetical protein